MDIEKAMEIINKSHPQKDWPCMDRLCWNARGFIEGFESRQAEVDELKKRIKELENQNEPYCDEMYDLSKEAK